jgi:hypothetical protein
MGSVHGIYGISAYLGLDGFRHAEYMQTSDDITPERFLEGNRSLRVAVDDVNELAAADRGLLRDIGYLKRGAKRGLYFQSYRSGYMPWHISEPEARRLHWNLLGLMGLLTTIRKGSQNHKWWSEKGIFPHATVRRADTGFTIEVVREPAPDLPARQPAEAADVGAASGLPVRRGLVVQCGFFVLPISVGAKHDRKMYGRLAMVVDAARGFVLATHLEEPNVPAEKMVADQMMKAIRTLSALPSEIQVCERRLAEALAGFERLGVRMTLKARLPMLEMAVEALRNGFPSS